MLAHHTSERADGVLSRILLFLQGNGRRPDLRMGMGRRTARVERLYPDLPAGSVFPVMLRIYGSADAGGVAGDPPAAQIVRGLLRMEIPEFVSKV